MYKDMYFLGLEADIFDIMPYCFLSHYIQIKKFRDFDFAVKKLSPVTCFLL